jgi:hypothetical protein
MSAPGCVEQGRTAFLVRLVDIGAVLLDQEAHDLKFVIASRVTYGTCAYHHPTTPFQVPPQPEQIASNA